MMMGLNLQGFKPIIICIAESTAVSEQFVDKLTVFIADSSEVEPLGQPDGIFRILCTLIRVAQYVHDGVMNAIHIFRNSQMTILTFHHGFGNTCNI